MQCATFLAIYGCVGLGANASILMCGACLLTTTVINYGVGTSLAVG